MADFYIRCGDERPILGAVLNDDLTGAVKVEIRYKLADGDDDWVVQPAEIVDAEARSVQVIFPPQSFTVRGLYWAVFKVYFSENEADTETFPNDRYFEISASGEADPEPPTP